MSQVILPALKQVSEELCGKQFALPPFNCFSHLKGAVLLAIGQVMYGKGQQCPPIVGHFPALDLMLPASSLP